jgi:DNA-binding transcriptional regulator YdaS (Cro superfamily)
MNREVLAKFTPDVLRGAASLGIGAKSLCTLLGIREKQLSELMCGLTDVNARQGLALEKRTGRSVAELAVLGIAGDARPSQRSKHASLIQDTLAMLSVSRSGRSAPASGRATKRASSTRKRTAGTRSRAA